MLRHAARFLKAKRLWWVGLALTVTAGSSVAVIVGVNNGASAARAMGKPYCGGPETVHTASWGPPGVAPIRDCIQVEVTPKGKDPGLPIASAGHHLMGMRTGPPWGGPTTQGIWGSVQVSDPEIPTTGAQKHFVASFFLWKINLQEPYMEVGWIECKWDVSVPCNNNNKVVFVRDSVDYPPSQIPHFYTQYSLTVGQHYDFTMWAGYQSSDNWCAAIWWNGNWEILTCHIFPGTTEMGSTWQNWELFDDDSGPTTWNVPITWLGYQVNTKIYQTGYGWRLWDKDTVLTAPLEGAEGCPPPPCVYDVHYPAPEDDNKYFIWYGHKH